MSDDEIFDAAWPATVARDEMFQRVTARGARLKATRRAVTSLLMVGSLLGAGAIGAGAIGSMGQPSRERGDVPELAGPVLRGSPDATAVPAVGDTVVDLSDDPHHDRVGHHRRPGNLDADHGWQRDDRHHDSADHRHHRSRG